MVVIGVVGGIASGKSTVTEAFRQLGADVVDADRLGHEVLEEPPVRAALEQRWGQSVLDAQGRVDRKAIGRIVFDESPQGKQERAFLQRVTHPRIGQRMRAALARMSGRPGVKAVVLDAPMLFEAGWDRYCNRIVFVDAPRSQRQQRARARGWTEVEFSAREAAQESLDEKRKRADWVIDNSKSPQHAFGQVQQLWRSLD